MIIAIDGQLVPAVFPSSLIDEGPELKFGSGLTSDPVQYSLKVGGFKKVQSFFECAVYI